MVSREALAGLLGPAPYDLDDAPARRVTMPGIAVGLSAGAGGGRIMFIEASRMAGAPGLRLTGRLGEVIKESAHIALGWVRSSAVKSGVLSAGEVAQLNTSELHIHLPEGAVGKDGPSGGAALATALVSLLSGRCVRTDTAVTGEMTLSGAILPVGGIRAKALAALHAGLRRVVLPRANMTRDVGELPPEVRSGLEFVAVDTVEEVLAEALAAPSTATPPPPSLLAKL